MAENLKAFDNLSEEGKDRLSAKEQADLNKISAEDIRSEKEKIGEKTFKVDGQTMKLKDIVEKLQFDPDGKTARLNWKSISFQSEFWGSDLWAAIQVYAIAYNKSIGKFKIDWKVYEGTIAWLQWAQTAAKVDKQPKQPEGWNESDEVKEQNIARLLTAIYTDYVGKYNDPKYNLLNTKSGVDNGTLKNKKLDGDKVTITYKSAIWKKENQQIVVDASKCKSWKLYSVDKFWKAIENAIAAKEAKLQQDEINRKNKEKIEQQDKNIIAWINAFKAEDFSNKFVKKYMKDGKLKFKNASVVARTVKFSVNWKEVTTSRNGLLNANGTFNKNEFKSRMESKYLAEAKAHVKNSVKTSLDALETTMSNVNNSKSAEEALKKCADLKSEVKWYWDDLLFRSELNSLANKETKLTKQFDYFKAKDKVNSTVQEVSDILKWVNLNNMNNKYDEALRSLAKVISVSKIDNNNYKLDYTKSRYRGKFAAVGKTSEYDKLIDDMTKKFNSRIIHFEYVK